VHRLHANTIPFYIRDLNIHRLWYPWRVVELTPLVDTDGTLYVNDRKRFVEDTHKTTMISFECSIRIWGKVCLSYIIIFCIVYSV
jgi:hypothetical protein